MLKNKEIAYAIGTFIEKYSSDCNRVTWNQSDDNLFKVEFASEIKVEEETLKASSTGSELLEFNASATIRFKEKEGSSVPIRVQRKIRGIAIIKETKNAANQVLPNVEQVLIINY